MEEYFLTGISSISETKTKNFENTSFAHTNYIWVIKLQLHSFLSLNVKKNCVCLRQNIIVIKGHFSSFLLLMYKSYKEDFLSKHCFI